MKHFTVIALIFASALAQASGKSKLQVTCYSEGGSGRAAVVDAVGIQGGLLKGVVIDKADPKNQKFTESFVAPADGCFVEATNSDTPQISAN